MELKTNNHWRTFVYANEVPEEILKDQFSYLDSDVYDEFFNYRGVWYHLSDFMRIERHSACPFPDGWEGYYSDSFFSGVLIRCSPDGEAYQIATYIS